MTGCAIHFCTLCSFAKDPPGTFGATTTTITPLNTGIFWGTKTAGLGGWADIEHVMTLHVSIPLGIITFILLLWYVKINFLDERSLGRGRSRGDSCPLGTPSRIHRHRTRRRSFGLLGQ